MNYFTWSTKWTAQKPLLTFARWLCLWSLCSGCREHGGIFISQLSQTSPLSLATTVIQATLNSHLGSCSRLQLVSPRPHLLPSICLQSLDWAKFIISLPCLNPSNNIPFTVPLNFLNIYKACWVWFLPGIWCLAPGLALDPEFHCHPLSHPASKSHQVSISCLSSPKNSQPRSFCQCESPCLDYPCH